MFRARLWMAELLVRGAKYLVESSPSEPEDLPDEEAPIPAGTPAVSWSDLAEEMILEGARKAQPPKKPEPDMPLAGSLRDRMNRRDL